MTHSEVLLAFRTIATALLLIASSYSAYAQQAVVFRCAAKPAHAREHVFSSATVYKQADGAQAFGFDLGTAPTKFTKGACSGETPFFFSVAEPDGNYQVTLELGGTTASTVTVRAESRRLFLDQLPVPANKTKQAVFNVHVRSAKIEGSVPVNGDANSKPLEVRLKPREIGALDWDEKLTLEFNGDHPSVRSISIRPIHDVPTVYLAGDSTMVDQDKEPWAAWGQMLPVFFGAGVSIANEAESGETIKSFVGERRLAKIESTWKSGDYLLVQFAHNDQKPGNGFVSIAEYKDLLRRYISDARAHGVTPMLVTSMNRRNFDADGKIVQTLGEYPQAMRDVAAEQHVGLIDLNALSKTLYEAMGEQGTLHAFVHYPANTFPDQPAELKDDTHFNSYGAYELARVIVQNIRDQGLPLARYLKRDTPRFDPAHPDPFADWKLPPSPIVSTVTPYGR